MQLAHQSLVAISPNFGVGWRQTKFWKSQQPKR